MDPLTHGIASWALSRAGCNRISPRATAILVTAGLVADVDLLSVFMGPDAYLHLHHTLAHSILGSAVLAFAVATCFWLDGKKKPRRAILFSRALALSVIGVAGHILLDVCGSDGVRLLWPFSAHFTALDLLPPIDPWILLLLLAGIALPSLFRLINEEIGAHRRALPSTRGAVLSLLAVLVFIGFRADRHSRAVDLLLANDYHGAVPLAVGAFPSGNSPFDWRGVASTENTIEILQVSVSPGDEFNPDRSVTSYKPEASPALAAAQTAPAMRAFLSGARFPLASIEHTDTGNRLTARDLRFPEDSQNPANVEVVVDLNLENQVTFQSVSWLASPMLWR